MNPENIKSLRLALGISQSEMALRLGYDLPNGKKTVDHLETGIKAPSGPVRRLLQIMAENINKG